MSKENIVRAWKDPGYRKSLSASELSGLPAHPAGAMLLSSDELEQASGGFLSLFGPNCKKDPKPDTGPYTSVTSIACCTQQPV